MSPFLNYQLALLNAARAEETALRAARTGDSSKHSPPMRDGAAARDSFDITEYNRARNDAVKAGMALEEFDALYEVI